jgi:hypothetical protein
LFGLGLAYAGSQNDDLSQPLLEVLEDFSFGFEVSAFTSLTFGLNFLGSGNDEVIGNLISVRIFVYLYRFLLQGMMVERENLWRAHSLFCMFWVWDLLCLECKKTQI